MVVIKEDNIVDDDKLSATTLVPSGGIERLGKANHTTSKMVLCEYRYNH
jgi:hypothetical protein